MGWEEAKPITLKDPAIGIIASCQYQRPSHGIEIPQEEREKWWGPIGSMLTLSFFFFPFALCSRQGERDISHGVWLSSLT